MAKNRTGILIALIVAITATSAPQIRAQILGPTIKRHALEIGYTFKWYERDFDALSNDTVKWSTGAFYFRFGACRWATISFEGGVWTLDHEDFPDNDYRRYVFGAGITSLLYARERFGVGFSVHYSEIFDHDRSRYQFHKNTRNVTAALQVQTDWELQRTLIELWGGPALIYDQSRQYPWQSVEPLRANTTGNFGLVAGINVLFIDRISAFGYVAYAEAFQPRLGVGYRF